MRVKVGMMVRMLYTNKSRNIKKGDLGLITEQYMCNWEKYDSWEIFFPKTNRQQAWFSSDEFEIIDDPLKFWRKQDGEKE